MSTLVGDPALRRLASFKLRGLFRKQMRRIRTPKGAVMTLLGVLLFALWIGSFLLHSLLSEPQVVDPAAVRPLLRIGMLVLAVLSLSGALVNRGLYLPREEIERLFSAPLARADLVRYRLLANAGRSLLGAVILGLVFMRRMPSPGLAFLGLFCFVQTVPLVNQMFAILAGRLEVKLFQRVRALRTLVVLACIAALGVMVPFLMLMDEDTAPEDVPLFGGLVRHLPRDVDGLFEHPALQPLFLPFEPWVRMASAGGIVEFLPWFGLGLGIWFLLFEGTARLPVDYREISLQTSSEVAARLRRVRRGGGAAAGRVSKRTVGWRIPWLFGRGPAGAIAWRKTGSMMRKARGTVIVSGLVLGFVTLLSSQYGVGEDESSLFAPFMIAFMGTFYLGAALRFDFRDELDRMEVVKSWPVSPARLFAAMLLPEVGLISSLLVAAIGARCVLAGDLQPVVLGLLALLPTVVLAWIALDNAIFLLAPVRFVPGQEGALQNAGRGLVMMFLRMLVLGLIGAVGAGVAFLGHRAAVLAGAPEAIAGGVSFLSLAVVLLTVDGLLLLLGGRMLSRFDVARERG